MNINSTKFKKSYKIALYSLFIVAIFAFSLLIMPFEFFFVSAIFVLVALRGMEKELKNFDGKPFQLFGRNR